MSVCVCPSDTARAGEALPPRPRELRVCRFPGALLDTAFLPPGITAVDDAVDPDIVAVATGRRVPAAVQRQIAGARRRFGWRPLLVAHYGEIDADPAANLADLDAVFSFRATAGRNTRHERYWRSPHLADHVAARNDLDPDGLWARPKTRFCNFVASNSTVGDPGKREAFARALMRHGPVDCPGRALNNTWPLPPNAAGSDAGALAKLEYLAAYRFTIAFEHVSADHYLTEKLLHALLAGSVPIYWGCPQVAEYVNPACFVNCHDYPSFDAAIEAVLALEAEPRRLAAMRTAPVLLPGSRISAAHDDLRLRWSILVDEALARRHRAVPAPRRGRAALAARAWLLELDPRARLAALYRFARALRRRAGRALRDTVAETRTLRVGIAQLCAEARHVRGLRTAARWVGWAVRRIAWSLVRRRYGQQGCCRPATASPNTASARRAETVAGAGQGLRPAAAGARAAWPGNALAPQSFDPREANPVGWTANVERTVLALGPPRLLPAGAARRAVAPDDLGALRHAHHVEDAAAFHACDRARVRTLARLAAQGVPVRVYDPHPDLASGLGGGLADLMTAAFPPGDIDGRERTSVAMRRLAHRDHARRPAGWPRVSVLLATRRPERLRDAIGSVARQDYPALELVLALHGNGFGDIPAPPRPGLAMRVVRIGAARPLGVVLDAATRAASGELLAKMDDDDGYGDEHVLDLVLARAYSGAELVGKGPEFVYLAGADVTLRRGRWRAERFSADIAGGGLLIGAGDLVRAGGWRPLPRAVDQALAADVQAVGGSVYRTHGFGFLLVRHGGLTTWEADDRRFLAEAETVAGGWRPDLAGVGDGARTPHVAGGERR